MDMDYIIEQLKNFLDKDNKIKQMSKKRKLQILAMFYLASKFEHKKEYKEKEVNEIINLWHSFNDVALLRRYLYQAGFLDRYKDGSLYWVKEPQPRLVEFESWIGGSIC